MLLYCKTRIIHYFNINISIKYSNQIVYFDHFIIENRKNFFLVSDCANCIINYYLVTKNKIVGTMVFVVVNTFPKTVIIVFNL